MTNFSLPGSDRVAVPGARAIGPADSNERLEATLLIRRRGAAELAARVTGIAGGNAAAGGSAIAAGNTAAVLSRKEFAERFGADAADLAAVRGFAEANGLAVVQEDASRRTVVLSGTVAQFNSTFKVQLQHMVHGAGSYRGRVGAVVLPSELQGIVEAVMGLDNRRQSAAHFRLLRPAAAAAVSYTPLQVASAYGFPSGTGQGQCVAIIELGGGFRPADLDAYFQNLGVASPSVVAVSVDHALNSPTGDANGPDGEVMLDIEIVGAIAPEATIAVYFAPNTDAGFLDAVTTAIHDDTRRPSVISISWGGPESSWTAQAMTAMDQAFQAAATMGITVCVASGDSGSSDGVTDGGDHVDFPCSSPFALACGGTSLDAGGGSIRSEVVWNDGANNGASGGGVSGFFALPGWQARLSTVSNQGAATALANRGVPDVAGNADPATGYVVRIDGTDTVIGGTSAVAPLWAALLARINQTTGKPAGYLNPLLYQNPQALRDIVLGNNGDFTAAAGWDACTGLGSPNGAALGSML
jgi:kumamolisin